jgi:hypothetical protein
MSLGTTIGIAWRPVIDQVEGWSVRSALQAQAVSGSVAAATNQIFQRPYVSEKMTMLQPTKGVLSGLLRAARGAENVSRPQSQIGPRPIVLPGEVNSLLSEPNTALAVLTRGRVARRDVIRLKPEY